MKKSIKKFTYTLIALIAVLLCFVITSIGGGAVFASAASASYSSALGDLQADPNFKAENYPSGGRVYKIEIIQIAESTTKELLVYTYQPYGKLEASSISISKTINDSFHPKKYSLELLNYEDVFYKYRVKDFKLEPDALRYYNVPTIWRKFDRQIDGSSSGGQTTNEIAYPVGKFWTAATVQGNVSYTLKQTEVVEIKNPYAGFVRRSNGFAWTANQSCDGHFIAFNTNYDITRLISADVTYKTQDYKKTLIGGTKYGDITGPQYRTVNHSEKTGNNVNGLFADKYTWDRISRTTDFIDDLKIEDEQVKSDLKARKWIINFLETDYTVPLGADNAAAMFGGAVGMLYNGFELFFGETTGTLVKEVAVLRLEFEVDGKHYNLGAVSNVVTGPETPRDEVGNAIDEFFKDLIEALAKVPWWVWLIIFAIIAIIVIAILALFFPVAQQILVVILQVLKKVGAGLWWFICLPFKALKKLIVYLEQRRAERESIKKRSTSPKRKKKAVKR